MALGPVACTSEAPPSDGAKLAIAVSPLDLASIDEVSFTLTVTNNDTPADVVWTKSGLLSTAYGTGKGDLSYVGPCDASASPNKVTLTIDSITADHIPLTADDWINPTPVVLETPCRENADTPVVFNLTIMRSAKQGFFDIGVNFSDIFCSAKVDCQPELLHNPESGVRGLTAVLGFACTAGEGQNTTLYFDDLKVVCAGPPARTYVLNPAPALAGNQGAVAGVPLAVPAGAPGLFQTAVYWGDEDFANLDKCYWNQAVGLDLASLGPDCRLQGEATAAARYRLSEDRLRCAADRGARPARVRAEPPRWCHQRHHHERREDRLHRLRQREVQLRAPLRSAADDRAAALARVPGANPRIARSRL